MTNPARRNIVKRTPTWTDAGDVNRRLRSLERDVADLYIKVDRLYWWIVGAAVVGLGGGPLVASAFGG